MANSINQFWDTQAREHGASPIATAPDFHYRQLEINAIDRFINPGVAYDVGCGNGYATLEYARRHRDALFYGLDSSGDMIKEAFAAREKEDRNAVFAVADIRTWEGSRNANTVISTRCLINLTSWQEQAHALLQMRSMLAPHGHIVLAENFMSGLYNLNNYRRMFELEEIALRWHNRYLEDSEFLPFVHEHFRILHQENIGCFYYLCSRVLYPFLCKLNGDEVRYDNPINAWAAQMPSLGAYDFSPNRLYVLTPK